MKLRAHGNEMLFGTCTEDFTVLGHILGKATECLSYTHRMSIVERALGQPSSCRIFFVSSLLAQASLPTKNSTCTPACRQDMSEG